MDTILIATLLIIFVSLLYFVLSTAARRNLPPGPPCLPFVGGRPYVKRPVWRWALAKRTEYPDIFCYKEVANWVVVLNSYKAIHTAFVDQANDFVGRMRDPVVGDKFCNSGVAMNDGPHWQTHRRLALHSLRDMGFGRAQSQELIRDEALRLVGVITAENGKSISTQSILMTATSNVVSLIVYGERVSDKGEEFLNQIKGVCALSHEDVDPGFLVTLMLPLLKTFPTIASYIPSVQAYNAIVEGMLNFSQKRIDEHVESFDPLCPPRDFIDDYILLQRAADQKTRSEILTNEHLRTVVEELFLTGTDTTAHVLMWALLCMAVNPGVQRNVHDQLDQQSDAAGGVQMSDRSKLPLVEAVLEETQRFCTLVPGSVARRTQRETTLLGYHIPADSLIHANLISVHFDENIFPDAHVFRPSRFMSNDKFKPMSQVIPFSLGKRACLGEALARMELFIFFSMLMKHFQVSLDPNDKIREEEILCGTDGTVHAPEQHKMIFIARN